MVNSDAIEAIVAKTQDYHPYDWQTVVRTSTGREYVYFQGTVAQVRAAVVELAEMLA
jgi:hypothetical protein